jgi:predicted O-methyltransferase YrrM
MTALRSAFGKLRRGAGKLKTWSKLARFGLLEAETIPTEMTLDEKMRLFELGRSKRGGRGVEIGSADGASSFFLASGLKPGLLYCVDPWQIEYRRVHGEVWNLRYRLDGTIERYKWDDRQEKIEYSEFAGQGDCPSFERFKRNTAKIGRWIRPLRGTSVEMAPLVIEPLDLLFVDGWHEYESVAADIHAWLPKVKPGGIVVMHDYGWAQGVQRVAREQVIPRCFRWKSGPNLFWGWMR